MSRVIVLNDLINFEPEKKNFNSRDAHVHISAPAAYCFLLLIEKQGELVTHEELYQYAWRQFGMEATANTLYQNISVIRRGLEKCGLQEDIIRTMPRRGFILSPAVKVQHSRTRDLNAQNQIVNSFGDAPQSTVNPEIQLAERYSTQQPEIDSAETIELHSSASEEKINTTQNPSATNILSLSDKEKETKSWLKQEKVIYQHEDTVFQGYNRLQDFILLIWFYTAIPLAIITFTWLSLSLIFDSHIGTLNFVPLTTINQCEYYINKDGEDDQRAIDFIRKLNKSCPYGKFNYMTKYTDGSTVSIINCRKKMNYISASTCISELITGTNNE